MKEVASLEDAVWYVKKPLGWSSFDVLKRLRGILRVSKIGHAGTLDPLATGLLILCTGKACKRISSFQQLPKTYEGLIRLGECRPSHDLETEISTRTEIGKRAEAELHSASARYTGAIAQRPPAFSAVKLNGRRAYSYARRGESITLRSKHVTIHSFDLLRVEIPWVHFRLCCSKGTYVRALVRDLGKDLGLGATLHALRRVAIGDISLKQAHTIEELAVWAREQHV